MVYRCGLRRPVMNPEENLYQRKLDGTATTVNPEMLVKHRGMGRGKGIVKL